MHLGVEHVPKGLIVEQNLVVRGAEWLLDFGQIAAFELFRVQNAKDVIDFDDCDDSVFVRVNLAAIAHELGNLGVIEEEHGDQLSFGKWL